MEAAGWLDSLSPWPVLATESEVGQPDILASKTNSSERELIRPSHHEGGKGFCYLPTSPLLYQIWGGKRSQAPATKGRDLSPPTSYPPLTPEFRTWELQTHSRPRARGGIYRKMKGQCCGFSQSCLNLSVDKVWARDRGQQGTEHAESCLQDLEGWGPRSSAGFVIVISYCFGIQKSMLGQTGLECFSSEPCSECS